MAKLFVSYSRKDSVAARKLIEAFKSIEQDVWVDWEAIPPAVDWLEQIFRGIEEAGAFVFLISPDSIVSEVCKVEVGHAVQNNKRIIPIVLRDVNPRDALESIRKLNWTFIRETDNFEEGLAKVKTAIELDLDWLEEHRRLQVRALEWHRKKDVSLLLRGRDLRNALHMLQTYTTKDPTPTELQQKYIEHSRKTERNRTLAWIATAIAVVALTILSYTTFQESVRATLESERATKLAILAQQNEDIALANAEDARNNERDAKKAQLEAETERAKAIEQEKLAKAQRSAARAQIYQTRTGELYTSTLLALDSLDESPNKPSEEALEILRQNISLLPLPVAQSKQGGSMVVLEPNPNDETFLAASNEQVCVRDIKTGRELFCETSASLTDAIFVDGGKSLVMADEDGTVRILNAEDGTQEREISTGSPVRDLDVDSKGKKLSIASQNGIVKVIDLNKANDKGFELQLVGTLTAADMSFDGRWFAAGAQSGHITVWNLNNREVLTHGNNRGTVLSIKFSSDNRFVTSGGVDNYAVGFDIESGNEAYRFLHADGVEDISVPSNNAWLATASDDTRARIWDIALGSERLVMSQDGAVTHLRISPDEKWIASTGEDHTVRVWSAYTGVEMLQIPLQGNGTALSFSSDTQRLITGDDDGNVRVWDISHLHAPEKYIRFNDLVSISKFTADGNALIASSAKQIWSLNPKNLPTGDSLAPQTPSSFKNAIYDLAVSPDGQTVVFSTYAEEYILYNLKTLISRRIKPSAAAFALAFSDDGSFAITGAENGIIETWDAKTGALIHSFDTGGDSILTLAVGPSQIAAGAENKILLLDPNAENKIMELEAPGKNQFLAFNNDGSLLAAANTSGQIEIWQKQNTGFELKTTLTREQPYSLAFHPKSNLLAVGTTHQVYLIDANDGAEVTRIPHKGIVYNVSISADGTTLATASQKIIQLWNIDALKEARIDDLYTAACSRLITNFSRSEWQVLFGNDQPKELCKGLPIPE